MTAGNKLWRNRKERKEWARRLRSEDPGLEVVHPHAAGIVLDTNWTPAAKSTTLN
jgi:hypothetical protein